MQITYCDLCACPVHGKRYYLVVVHDEAQNKGHTPPTSKESYEIDESCYLLLVKMFDLKKSKMNEVKKFLDNTYKLPVNRRTKSKTGRGKGLRKKQRD